MLPRPLNTFRKAIIKGIMYEGQIFNDAVWGSRISGQTIGQNK